MAIIDKQKGVVLIVSLVFLVSLTAVASALMLNTTTDIKMSGASEQKLIAKHAVISAVDEAISDQVNGEDNLFENQVFPIEVVTVDSVDVDNVIITNPNGNNTSTQCSHMRLASSDKIECNKLILTVNKLYGKHETSNVSVNAGISQQLIATN